MKFRSLQNLFAINKNTIPICQAMPEKKEATRWEGDWIRFKGFDDFTPASSPYIRVMIVKQRHTIHSQRFCIELTFSRQIRNSIESVCFVTILRYLYEVFLYLFYFHSSFEWFVSAKYSWFVRDSPVPLISFHYRMLSLHRNAMRKINQKYWVEKGIQ